MKLAIGLTGSIGSGKTEISAHLCRRYGAKQLRFSQILMDVLDRLGLPKDRKNLQTLGDVIRKSFGEDVIIKAFRNDLMKCDSDVVIVDGIRYLNEVEMLRSLKSSVLIYVEAPAEVRYQRILSRGQKGEANISFEEFMRAEERPTEKNLPQIKECADYVIENTGTVDELLARTDQILSGRL